MPSAHLQTYAQRAEKHANPTAKALLETIERKSSNLCVSVDVTKKADFLRIIDIVGPYVCLVKVNTANCLSLTFSLKCLYNIRRTSISSRTSTPASLTASRNSAQSTISSSSRTENSQTLVRPLVACIARPTPVLTFRPGNTVALQYSSGVHKIASWSHITNAHPVPGPGIVTGLASVGTPLGRGLLLLAEMSTKGNLATGTYTADAVRMARAHRDFVIGFIAMRRMDGVGAQAGEAVEDEDFLILTPGVGLDVKGDSMGQQYRTPREVVLESGCDVIIVGRGIYGKGSDAEVREQAERYRREGWAAYEGRVSSRS